MWSAYGKVWKSTTQVPSVIASRACTPQCELQWNTGAGEGDRLTFPPSVKQRIRRTRSSLGKTWFGRTCCYQKRTPSKKYTSQGNVWVPGFKLQRADFNSRCQCQAYFRCFCGFIRYDIVFVSSLDIVVFCVLCSHPIFSPEPMLFSPCDFTESMFLPSPPRNTHIWWEIKSAYSHKKSNIGSWLGIQL